MKRIQRVPKTLQPVVLAGVILAGPLGMAITAAAQDVSDLQTPKGSLVLKSQGSFFVGGQNVFSDGLVGQQIPGFTIPASGHVTYNQMYVRYMIPQGGDHNVPVVMIHGGTLSGKSWETTPDGRMGWDEYFVRQGHAVYVPDQVSRARSGFNQAAINNVLAGNAPPSTLPNILRLSDEIAWTIFRFGPTFGTPYADEQFPVQAADKFSKQGIPDLNFSLPDPNITAEALAALAIQLNGAVIMGHSESGLYPLQAALTNATGTKGLIDIEPGGCNATVFTNQQIATLATVPILVVFGDHLDTPNSVVNWPAAFSDCQAFIARVNAANGNAQMLHPADLGIHGNSHMIMLDKNNLQIADLILKWIDGNVGKNKVAKN
jgi:pimeloyl-ACP methyl ester carboxylesterase